MPAPLAFPRRRQQLLLLLHQIHFQDEADVDDCEWQMLLLVMQSLLVIQRQAGDA